MTQTPVARTVLSAVREQCPGITYRDLAQRLNEDPERLKNAVGRRKNFPPTLVRRIAKAVGMTKFQTRDLEHAVLRAQGWDV